MKPRVVFMGTPIFATAILKKLIEMNQDIVLVVSQPDRIVGRKKELKATPVKAIALQYGIPVFQPEKLKEDMQMIIDIKPDIIITCAYGQMVPKMILECPTIGCFNVHGSLLPKWRGGAPIHRAIMNGDKQTGITLMEMVSKMDAGDMIASSACEIEDDDTMSSLHDKLMIVASDLVEAKWAVLINKTYQPVKQDEQLVTYGYNIERSEERIDWSLKGQQIRNHVRGLNAYPGAYMMYQGQVIKVWQVHFEQGVIKGDVRSIVDVQGGIAIQVEDGLIWLEIIQFAGKKASDIKSVLNGQHGFVLNSLVD